MRLIVLFITVLILLSGSQAGTMERFDVLTTEELKVMLDGRAAGSLDFILVNTLDELISQDSSIPGSVFIPWYRINELSHRLGSDKSKLIVTYCMGYR